MVNIWTHRVVEIADITIKKDVAESNLRSFAKLCILNGYFPDWYFSFSLSIGFLSNNRPGANT